MKRGETHGKSVQKSETTIARVAECQKRNSGSRLMNGLNSPSFAL